MEESFAITTSKYTQSFYKKLLQKMVFVVDTKLNKQTLFHLTSQARYLLFLRMYDWFLRIQNVKKNLIYQDKYPKRWCIYFDTSINWSILCMDNVLSLEFIEEYNTKLEWYNIWAYQQLPEDILWKYSDRRLWGRIFEFQTLSEDFIEKYIQQTSRPAVCWDLIAAYQHRNVSDAFVKKYYNEWFEALLFIRLERDFH